MALGWAQLAGAIGNLINKIPLLSRTERYKAQIRKLEIERKKVFYEPCTDNQIQRMRVIDNKLKQLHTLLEDAAKD